jgi:hypothetical protein
MPESASSESGPRCDPGSCDPGADCFEGSAGILCRCRSQFKGDGGVCARFVSCNDLHAGEPTLPNGIYTIRPASSPDEFVVYCDMATSGGGWTLVLNESPSFDPMGEGSTTDNCHDDNCTNRAYATVPVEADMMFDMRDGDITGDAYLARAVVLGVHSATVGKTVRTLFTTDRFFLEKEDNSNVFVTTDAPAGCSALPDDMRLMLCNDCDAAPCGTAVVTFGDRGSDSTCPEVQNTVFAIGGSYSYTIPWPNCAGWPQAPNSSGHHHYPDNFRIWVR